ncbi:unnamed protein product [Acanthosepion pharaonis]|uniref:Uncharacterized protein n=1 Tax=Acanthosepion pharaonis TaxID=158019 RepID=A0A812DAG6_ACAPH|nr:unnamed protein product [Sepia pharaonis]
MFLLLSFLLPRNSCQMTVAFDFFVVAVCLFMSLTTSETLIFTVSDPPVTLDITRADFGRCNSLRTTAEKMLCVTNNTRGKVCVQWIPGNTFSLSISLSLALFSTSNSTFFLFLNFFLYLFVYLCCSLFCLFFFLQLFDLLSFSLFFCSLTSFLFFLFYFPCLSSSNFQISCSLFFSSFLLSFSSFLLLFMKYSTGILLL